MPISNPPHPARPARVKFRGKPPTENAMADSLRNLSVERLEEMLLEASSLSGRAAMARVTAIRTLLARRPQQSSDEREADARRTLELVNAARGPERQLSEVHPTWVSSILTDPGWAEVYASDEEMELAAAWRERNE